MHNKAPMWNESSQVYQLDFGGRVTQESAKNFQIEFKGRQVRRRPFLSRLFLFPEPFSLNRCPVQGDAIRKDRRQRVHAGLSVSVQRVAGVRRCSGERHAATQVTVDAPRDAPRQVQGRTEDHRRSQQRDRVVLEGTRDRRVQIASCVLSGAAIVSLNASSSYRPEYFVSSQL